LLGRGARELDGIKASNKENLREIEALLPKQINHMLQLSILLDKHTPDRWFKLHPLFSG